MSTPSRIVGYGLSDALPNIFPAPIIAKRVPTTHDIGYPLGQLWIYPVTNSVFVLASVINNSANWVGGISGSGSFSSLTVTPGPISLTGDTTINTTGNGTFTLGNPSSNGLIDIEVGPGAFEINGNGSAILIGNDAAANGVLLGTDTAGATTNIYGGNYVQVAVADTGFITLGTPTMTGNITLGDSLSGQTVRIANVINSGATVVNIASAASAADTTVNILSGAASAGVQTFNLFGSGATRAGHINIATGAAAHEVTIGSSSAGLIEIQVGPGAFEITGNGNAILIGNDAAANSILLGTDTTGATTNIYGGNYAQVSVADTGFITLGTPTMTGNITLGDSLSGQTIRIGSVINSGATVINIANAASAADVTINVLSGASSAGVQTFNLFGSGATRAGTVNIGTGAAAHALNLGNSAANIAINGTLLVNNTTADATSIGSGVGASGTMNINTGDTSGNIRIGSDVAGNFVTISGNTFIHALFATTEVVIHNDVADTTPAVLTLEKSEAGGPIVTGDSIGSINFDGLDSTSAAYSTGAKILSVSSGTIGAAKVPADLEFFTKPDSATAITQRMVIASTGVVTINAPDSGSPLVLGGAVTAGGKPYINVGSGATSPQILSGSGAPSFSAQKGSLYLRTDGSGVNDRAYIATDNAGTWTAIVTVA